MIEVKKIPHPMNKDEIAIRVSVEDMSIVLPKEHFLELKSKINDCEVSWVHDG